MKDNETPKKSSESMTAFLHKASDLTKKSADGIKEAAKTISEKAKSDSYLRKVKKYNPLFPDKFKSENFNLPNMIEIVDDAVRRGIDVCEGAIGWISKVNDVEILHLYDEWIEESGIQFIPSGTCNTMYYVDNFDRNRFIKIDCIFDKAHEEKLAELERIAYLLGAKSCSIELVECAESIEVKRASFKANESWENKISSSEKSENSYQNVSLNKRSGKTTSYFKGSDTPTRPELKWFAHDDTIKRLIDMRCSDKNSIKSRILELKGSSSATMSQTAACSIDAVMGKMNGKANAEMEKQVKKENSSKLVYEIEF